MDKIKWIAVKSSKDFLDIIELNSVGLEEAKKLYYQGKYDDAVYEYYRFSLKKFKNSSNTIELGDEDHQTVLKNADMIMDNKIALLGYDYLYVGDPINWDIYPENDKQWQNHLGYMYFPKDLLLAYIITQEKKYLDKWTKIHMEFIENHPFGVQSLVYSMRLPMYKNEYLPVCGGEGFCTDYIGGSWISLSSSRVEQWIKGLIFLANNDALDISLLCNMTASIMLQHLPVLLNNPRKGTPNQFIHTSNMMINISVAFWETKMAPAAYLVGMQRLEQAIGEFSLLPDGTDLEQCFGYNMGLVNVFGDIYSNRELKGNKRLEKLYEKIMKRCEYLSQVKDPLGYTPALAKRQNNDDNSCKEIVRFHNMYPQSEIITNIYNALIKHEVCRGMKASVDFPYGGYSVLRDGWEEKDRYLLMKYSRYSQGHKHEDANSVVVTAFGKRLLIDSGNYNYSNDPESMVINHYMQSSRSHNTIDVDGLSQSRIRMDKGRKVDERYPDSTTNEIEYEKYMQLKNIHTEECKGRRVHEDVFEMVEGIYEDGYSQFDTDSPLLDGKHIRRVIFIKGVGYIIDDTICIDDDKEHEFFMHWNLSKEFTPDDVVFEKNAFKTKRENVNIYVMSISDKELSYKLYYGQENPLRGWCSTEYGKMIQSPDIDVIAKCASSLRIISFLYPFEKNSIEVNCSGMDFNVNINERTLEYICNPQGGKIIFGDDVFEY